MIRLRKIGRWCVGYGALGLMLGGWGACSPTIPVGDDWECTPAPPLMCGSEQGVSAPYAGVVDGEAVVAGGCNFPGLPAAEGGEKVFYQTIYRLEKNGESGAGVWRSVGELPVPVAYGVGITVPQGLVCVGGTDGRHRLRHTWLLQSGAGGEVVLDSLPDLPVGLDNAAGAYGAGALYVAGGQSDDDASIRAFRLVWPGGTEWEELPLPPGGPRVQPVAVFADSCFYLMGGYVPPTEAGEEARVQCRGCRYEVASGHWVNTAPLGLAGDTLCRALVGAAGAVSVDGTHLFFIGGVDGARFLRAVNRPLLLARASEAGNDSLVAALEKEAADYLHHSVSWYRFSSALWTYDVRADRWERTTERPEWARAGAGLIVTDEGWLVVCGETKPGIRSSAVTVVQRSGRLP